MNTGLGLATSDPRYLQIDSCPPDTDGTSSTTPTCGTTFAGDANLYGPTTQADHNPPYAAPGAFNTLDPLGPDLDLNQSVTPNIPSNSIDFPGSLTATSPVFIDWLDLIGYPPSTTDTTFQNHFRGDYYGGTDPSSFPLSNSCVGSSQVLDKMDLTFVSVSNNTDYAYFGVQRRDNSGDAGYMWIFNAIAPPSWSADGTVPQNLFGTGGCASTQYPLILNVSAKDVLFRGHFAPSSDEPLLTVYKYNPGLAAINANTVAVDGSTVYPSTLNTDGVTYYIPMPAKSAINWTLTIGIDGLAALGKNTCDPVKSPQYCFWLLNAGAIAAAAANTSPAGLGRLGDTTDLSTAGLGKVGLKSWMANGTTEKIGSGKTAVTWECTDALGGCMQDSLFAEVAVKISTFLGTNVCGGTFYGSIISRSSGTTPSPDMKDLAGPFQFNFGSASVSIKKQPLCSLDFQYKIDSFTGLNGAATPSKCKWHIQYTGGTDQVFTDYPTYSNYNTDTSSENDCAYSTNAATWFNYTNLPATQPNSTNTASLTTPTLQSGQAQIWVEVEDAGGCKATSDKADITTYPALGLNINLTPYCTDSFDAASTPSGGSLSYTYAWAFSPTTTTTGYTVAPTTASTQNVTGVTVSKGGVPYHAALTITDARTDITCTAATSQNTTPYDPVSVSLGLSATSLACSTATPLSDNNFDTGVKFTATVTGGSGSYNYHWGGAAATCATASGTFVTATKSDCTINEPFTCSSDVLSGYTCAYDSLSVYVNDPTCGNTNTPTGAYSKVTTVSASVNNP